MSIAKLKLDESTKLEFGVSITGAESRPSARFVIEGPQFSVAYPCRPVGEGIEVEIGNFEKMFEAGEYPVRLEILIDDKLYMPFQDTIQLDPNVHVTTKPRTVREKKETIKVEKVKVRENTGIKREPVEQLSEAELQKQRKLAYLIAKTAGYNYDERQTVEQIIEEALHTTNLNEEKKVLISEMIERGRKMNIKTRLPKNW
jgi:hypothetical protein